MGKKKRDTVKVEPNMNRIIHCIIDSETHRRLRMYRAHNDLTMQRTLITLLNAGCDALEPVDKS